MELPKRLTWAVLGLALALTVGTVGYELIEGWGFLDSLYMTVITLTTLGYQEVHPLDTAGRIFTMVLALGGVGGALYALSTMVEFVMEGRLGTTLGRQQMKNRIAHLKDHFILCGYGRVGHEVARILAGEGVEFMVIDKDKEAIARAEIDGRTYLLADAADEAVLKEVGIERARGLIVALGSDADSTYVTLSARQLNPNLFIEARASNPEAETKLKRAGADRIISPYSIGARHMALLALRPEVVDFMDTLSYHGEELQMESLTVGDGSPLIGERLGQVRARSKAAVLAVTRQAGPLVANPSDEEQEVRGDRLIALGTRAQLRVLEEFCERCKQRG